MRRRMMKSKIHRATVTDADLDYVGSITLDVDLMKLADIREMEQVHVLDIDNGNRLVTYAIKGGPGDVCLNGAAARLVSPGDKVIIISYADYDEAELDDYRRSSMSTQRTDRSQPRSPSRWPTPSRDRCCIRNSTQRSRRSATHPQR